MHSQECLLESELKCEKYLSAMMDYAKVDSTHPDLQCYDHEQTIHTAFDR